MFDYYSYGEIDELGRFRPIKSSQLENQIVDITGGIHWTKRTSLWQTRYNHNYSPDIFIEDDKTIISVKLQVNGGTTWKGLTHEVCDLVHILRSNTADRCIVVIEGAGWSHALGFPGIKALPTGGYDSHGKDYCLLSPPTEKQWNETLAIIRDGVVRDIAGADIYLQVGKLIITDLRGICELYRKEAA